MRSSVSSSWNDLGVWCFERYWSWSGISVHLHHPQLITGRDSSCNEMVLFCCYAITFPVWRNTVLQVIYFYFSEEILFIGYHERNQNPFVCWFTANLWHIQRMTELRTDAIQFRGFFENVLTLWLCEKSRLRQDLLESKTKNVGNHAFFRDELKIWKENAVHFFIF